LATKNLHFSKLAANDQESEKLVKSIFAETAKSGLEFLQKQPKAGLSYP